MTVEELIEKLKKLPKKLEVYHYEPEFASYFHIEEPEVVRSAPFLAEEGETEEFVCL